jgi:hypothetical protein
MSVLAVGCHIASGLDELEVIEGAGGSGGNSGTGGDGPAPLTTVDEVCELLCEFDQELMCNLESCDPQSCRENFFVNTHPWCEPDIVELGECYREEGAGAFHCEGFIVPDGNTCFGENAEYSNCLFYESGPEVGQDCRAACAGPLTGPQCPSTAQCEMTCQALTSAGNCQGVWSGLAHCAATNPSEPWQCFGDMEFPLPFPGSTCDQGTVLLQFCPPDAG